MLGVSNPPMNSSTESSHRELLNEAIESATTDRLRVTLKHMCNSSAEALRLASEQLLTHGPVEDESEDGSDEEFDNATDTATSGPRGQKRGLDVTRPRYQVCIQCDEEYDVEENELEDDLCQWHEGMYIIFMPGDDFVDMLSFSRRA